MADTRISVRVHPGASKNELMKFSEGAWHMKVAAPPVKGKANKELVEFLSQILGVSKSSVEILKGHTSHNKILTISGLTPNEVNRMLTTYSSSSADRKERLL